MQLNRVKFMELLKSDFNNSQALAAEAMGITKQRMSVIVKDPKANAGEKMLGHLADYCFKTQKNFWTYVILPSQSTKV